MGNQSVQNPLTPAQDSLLGKGPNFAVTSQSPPNVDYISAIEYQPQSNRTRCTKPKSDVNSLLKRVPITKANLTKEERKALMELKGIQTGWY